MLTRGKLLVQLSNKNDQKRLELLEVPKYESTDGVNLKTIDLKHLKEVLLGDFSTRPTPVTSVSPYKNRTDNNFFDGASHSMFETQTIGSSHANAKTKNVRASERIIGQEEDSCSESVEDPFAESGSSYAPSDISTTSSEPKIKKPQRQNELSVVEMEPSTGIIPSPYVSSGSTSIVSETTDDADHLETPNCGSRYRKSVSDVPNENRQDKHLSPVINIASKISYHENERMSSINSNNASPKIVTVGVSRIINGNRLRDKRHSCYFCQKILSNNMARHMENKHHNEMEVAKILAMSKKSKKRRDAFSNLIKYGDFYHNCDVLTLKRGELILTRRPNENEQQFTSYSDYGPCPECLGFFLKKQIWHHLKYSCISRKEKNSNRTEDNNSGKGPIAESTAMLNGILGTNLTPEFLTIVNQFRDDEISRRCREDDTIMRYGAFMFEKYSSTQSELIRQSMRQLGRLTLQMKSYGEDFNNFSEMLVPEKFDSIVTATKEISKTTRQDCTKRPEFGIPSLALKIGYAIKKCAAIQRGLCLRRGDLRNNKKHLAFLQLLNLEWSVRISSNALATMYSRKKSAEDLLPLTADLVKLNEFLDSKITEIKKNLCQSNYHKLGSLTLSRIIMFNKRRSGEAAKMTLQQYASRPNWSETSTHELKESLTPLENKLATTLTIVKIVGKRGRVVPIILTKDMKESIDLIISKRVQYGILSNNPYIFALSNTPSGHLRGHDCLKKCCNEAELQLPNLVTSTKLRKYVATVCQVFNLTENEYDWLARHLGHDIRVHREFYRLQENAVELTKVSRLLIAVDQGEAHKFAGKKLEDINIRDLDGIVEDDEIVNEIEHNYNDFNVATNGKTVMQTGRKVPCDLPKRSKNTEKGICVKKIWSNEEKEIILKKFRTLIKIGKLPGKQECEELMEEHKIFTGRKWTDLKYFVKNYLSKCKKIS